MLAKAVDQSTSLLSVLASPTGIVAGRWIGG
ncbi:UNVERIFIED_ORG: hypothetical protein J2W87_002074, partial [Pseudomonas putida]|nr:hypothetical protein [Pseudomonas putida]